MCGSFRTGRRWMAGRRRRAGAGEALKSRRSGYPAAAAVAAVEPAVSKARPIKGMSGVARRPCHGRDLDQREQFSGHSEGGIDKIVSRVARLFEHVEIVEREIWSLAGRSEIS